MNCTAMFETCGTELVLVCNNRKLFDVSNSEVYSSYNIWRAFLLNYLQMINVNQTTELSESTKQHDNYLNA